MTEPISTAGRRLTSEFEAPPSRRLLVSKVCCIICSLDHILSIFQMCHADVHGEPSTLQPILSGACSFCSAAAIQQTQLLGASAACPDHTQFQGWPVQLGASFQLTLLLCSMHMLCDGYLQQKILNFNLACGFPHARPSLGTRKL